MNDYREDQKRVKSKIYRLNPGRVLGASPVPVLLESPLSPPGQEFSWFTPSYQVPISAVLSRREGGFSSKRLYQCGDVWYYDEFFDEKRVPFRFEYGPRPEAPKSFDVNSLGAWLRGDLQDGTVILTDSVKNVVEFAENSVNNPDEFTERTPFTDEQKQAKTKINRANAKKTLRMTVNLNALHYMYTLTFAPRLHENVPGLRFILPLEEQKSRLAVEKAWDKRRGVLARWCKKQGYEFRYVKVLEKHLGNKAEEVTEKVGTYHIHLATDKPIDKDVLQRLWGFGVVWVDDFNKPRRKGQRSKGDPGRDREVCDPGIYMSKYMEKDFDDADLHGFRAYSPSQNLKHPRPLRDEEVVKKEIEMSGAEEFTVFDKEFTIEYAIFRKGQEPHRVKLIKRHRIFNFRVPPKHHEGLHPDMAGRLLPT